jgi:hypothetical protein
MKLTGVVATLSALLVVAGCSGDAGAEQPITVAGKVTLIRGINLLGLPDGRCEGALGFDDVHSRANVTVVDSAGKKLAVGHLGTGRLLGGTSCRFAFRIPDVPGGETVYALRVGSRSDYDFSKQEAGKLALSLTYHG